MSARLGALERERQMLISRSSLARLRMHRDAHRLCQPLQMRSVAAAAARAPAIRGATLGLAVSVFGVLRVSRTIAIVSSILSLVRLAR